MAQIETARVVKFDGTNFQLWKSFWKQKIWFSKSYCALMVSWVSGHPIHRIKGLKAWNINPYVSLQPLNYHNNYNNLFGEPKAE